MNSKVRQLNLRVKLWFVIDENVTACDTMTNIDIMIFLQENIRAKIKVVDCYFNKQLTQMNIKLKVLYKIANSKRGGGYQNRGGRGLETTIFLLGLKS